MNDRDVTVDADGRYTLTIGADRADAAGGDWIELPQDTINVIVRSYFQRPTSAQNDSSVFWRFLLPDDDPEQPTSEVVTI